MTVMLILEVDGPGGWAALALVGGFTLLCLGGVILISLEK